jgi:hypothetical protein
MKKNSVECIGEEGEGEEEGGEERVKETEVVLLLFFSFTIFSCCLSDDRHQQY